MLNIKQKGRYGATVELPAAKPIKKTSEPIPGLDEARKNDIFMKTLQEFSEQELFSIYCIPTMLGEVAWYCTNIATKMCAAQKMEGTKYLCRKLRELELDYRSHYFSTMNTTYYILRKRAEQFIAENQLLLMQLYSTVFNEISHQTKHIKHQQIRAWAFAAMITLAKLDYVEKRSEEKFADRVPAHKHRRLPHYRAQAECLRLFFFFNKNEETFDFEMTPKMEVATNVMLNKLMAIDYQTLCTEDERNLR